ncbi:UDP-glycosyltransferase UGT5-like [Aricia agestis]|uniref:UDP-glycosyltransferase UGT5-like n=1 Tax=Aricia agestis TaxID=91739 RepID=UPI001C20AF77|nr:UDP-glycosyltransferase UGT5-like [Aricia agestis]
MRTPTPVSVLLAVISTTTAARILALFPMPSISHQVVFRQITRELVNRGHEVVVITTDPEYNTGKTPANLTEIDVHDVGYQTWVKVITKELAGNPADMVTQMKALIKSIGSFFEAEMQTEVVKELINKEKGNFDLLITELCIRPSLGFSHIFKVPLIQVSTMGSVLYNDDVIGSTTHPIYYPNSFNRRVYNLTMLEKIEVIWNDWRLKSYYKSLEEEEHEMMKRIFGADVSPLNELKENVHMTMLNIHPIWTDNQPVPPSLVYIGGIHKSPVKPLPEDLQTYLNSSKNGVIYVSFGTNSIPSRFDSEDLKVLLGVLSKLKYNVLLKWDQDHLPYDCKNIKIAKWFPQSDLLRHPKVKLFITQGGLQSTDEAIIGGVPLIGIPIMGDQYYNAEKYEHHKIGKKLDWNNFDAKTFRNAIETIIGNESYRMNIIKLRRVMDDQPQEALTRAIWWIEYVLRHGGAEHLRPPTANMPLYDYLEMDLVIFVVSLAFATISAIVIIACLLWKFCCKRDNVVNEKHKKMTTTIKLIFALAVIALTAAYSDLDDKLVIETVVKEPSLMRQYTDCFLDKGPCTAPMNGYKSHMIEAVFDGCRECNDIERHMLRVYLQTLRDQFPTDYTEFKGKFDKNNHLDTTFATIKKY